MKQNKTEKPNVVVAKVTGIDYDFPDALYTIFAANKKTYESMRPLHVNESEMPADLDKGATITIWLSTDFKYRNIAFKDRIIEPAYDKKSVLNPATQKHFDNYKEKSNANLELKQKLQEIEQKIAMIKSINTESDISAEQAKVTLFNFLDGQEKKLRTGLIKKR